MSTDPRSRRSTAGRRGPSRVGRGKPPELPRLPWRRNRTKRLLTLGMVHLFSAFTGVGLLVALHDEVAFVVIGGAFLVLAVVAVVAAVLVQPSSCPACEGALTLEPVRYERAKVIVTTATCDDCGEAYESYRHAIRQARAPG